MKKFILIISLLLFYSTSKSQTPYVILISFDGFRWDYGQRDITPNLDLVKEEGVWASSLRPCFPTKTFPNHYSIISGCYIDKHGIIANSFTDYRTNESYSLGDTGSVRDSKWYKSEAFWTTAERQGVKCASYFWPGSEVNDAAKRPSYFENYEHNRPYEERISGVLEWLQFPYTERPHFITLYFHETDTYGHDYGPESTEVNYAIARLDSMLGLLLDGLREINIYDSTNVILVSDHGMTEISSEKVVNIEKLLDGLNYKMQGEKPFVLIDPAENNYVEILEKLQNNNEHYRVYEKSDLPDFYHYKSNDLISPIILIADIGWSLVNNDWLESMEKYGTKGNHGYEKDCLDMHGIFYARGPNFKSGYKTGTVWNIDIYPLLCSIFGIDAADNIDGKLERIEFILNEK